VLPEYLDQTRPLVLHKNAATGNFRSAYFSLDEPGELAYEKM